MQTGKSCTHPVLEAFQVHILRSDSKSHKAVHSFKPSIQAHSRTCWTTTTAFLHIFFRRGGNFKNMHFTGCNVLLEITISYMTMIKFTKDKTHNVVLRYLEIILFHIFLYDYQKAALNTSLSTPIDTWQLQDQPPTSTGSVKSILHQKTPKHLQRKKLKELPRTSCSSI